MNKLELTCLYEHDDYDDLDLYQEIYDKDNDISFSVGNLNYCPEDAIIDRSLFNACDYVDTLNKGIELAKKGYEEVTIKYEKSKEV